MQVKVGHSLRGNKQEAYGYHLEPYLATSLQLQGENVLQVMFVEFCP